MEYKSQEPIKTREGVNVILFGQFTTVLAAAFINAFLQVLLIEPSELTTPGLFDWTSFSGILASIAVILIILLLAFIGFVFTLPKALQENPLDPENPVMVFRVITMALTVMIPAILIFVIYFIESLFLETMPNLSFYAASYVIIAIIGFLAFWKIKL